MQSEYIEHRICTLNRHTYTTGGRGQVSKCCYSSSLIMGNILSNFHPQWPTLRRIIKRGHFHILIRLCSISDNSPTGLTNKEGVTLTDEVIQKREATNAIIRSRCNIKRHRYRATNPTCVRVSFREVGVTPSPKFEDSSTVLRKD